MGKAIEILITVLLAYVLGSLAHPRFTEVVSDTPDFKRSSCSGKWAKIPQSTMCLYSDNTNAKDCGVSSADQTEILRAHNDLRGKVNPQAANMMKMYWNDDLATLAQRWAMQCTRSHDTSANKEIPGWGKPNYVGQSWAAGGIFPTWTSAVKTWYSEVEYFTYGSSVSKGNQAIGHYTQLVRDEANVVGCGYCMCSGEPYYVCNYYKGNPMDKGRPYKSGSTCADCGSCSAGLCDCGNTVCKNGGTLNTATCACDCAGKWGGSDCSTCTGEDNDNCSWYGTAKCTQWDNVPEECPHMCGLC